MSDRIYQTRPFTGRVTVTYAATDSERTREKNAVATVPGQLNANLLECLCVSLAALSLRAQRVYIVEKEVKKEESMYINAYKPDHVSCSRWKNALKRVVVEKNIYIHTRSIMKRLIKLGGLIKICSRTIS